MKWIDASLKSGLVFEMDGALKLWRFTNFFVSILTIYIGLIVIFSEISCNFF
nr:MAG TPA: hypothetical protein [Caudoviricetes sp.]